LLKSLVRSRPGEAPALLPGLKGASLALSKVKHLAEPFSHDFDNANVDCGHIALVIF